MPSSPFYIKVVPLHYNHLRLFLGLCVCTTAASETSFKERNDDSLLPQGGGLDKEENTAFILRPEISDGIKTIRIRKHPLKSSNQFLKFYIKVFAVIYHPLKTYTVPQILH